MELTCRNLEGLPTRSASRVWERVAQAGSFNGIFLGKCVEPPPLPYRTPIILVALLFLPLPLVIRGAENKSLTGGR